jgi:hypothetical protein
MEWVEVHDVCGGAVVQALAAAGKIKVDFGLGGGAGQRPEEGTPMLSAVLGSRSRTLGQGEINIFHSGNLHTRIWTIFNTTVVTYLIFG